MSDATKALRYACQFCQSRKIKCDRTRPKCASCARQNRKCTYQVEAKKPRPSNALLRSLHNEKSQIEDVLIRLKEAPPQEKDRVLDSIQIHEGRVKIATPLPMPDDGSSSAPQESLSNAAAEEEHSARQEPKEGVPFQSVGPRDEASSGSQVDISSFLSLNDQGQVQAFGPASSLHQENAPVNVDNSTTERARHQLVANAALQRQQEYKLDLLPDLDGVPSDLASHLLDLHWNRQHHTFLLTYRPTFTRDLLTGGPYASPFLLNAIFACASKYSDRMEVRDNPADHRSAGGRFFRRCTALLMETPPFEQSSLPTVAGLLLLGSTFVATGDVSKGWLYSGFAFRMVFDLGLHIDYIQPGQNEEDLELRRRLFWGAYVCDKLQSLYTGRPASIDLRHCSVSLDLLDIFEENELWTPYIDFKHSHASNYQLAPVPIHSVSAFRQLCTLSELMTRVIDCVYVIKSYKTVTRHDLSQLDNDLQKWHLQLPDDLKVSLRSDETTTHQRTRPPNILILNAMYHALVILLHRPFLSDGHLRTWCHPADPWKRCTEAANSISGVIAAYRKAYTLRRGPYVISYAAYVACTIHVRNATFETDPGPNSMSLATTLTALEELTIPNPGVAVPLEIVRRLMRRYKVTCPTGTPSQTEIQGVIPYTEDLQSIDMDFVLQTFDTSEIAWNQEGGEGYMGDWQSSIDSGFMTGGFDDSLFGYLSRA